MTAKPTVTVSHAEDPFTDEHGQQWSPAVVTVAWPPTPGLRAPTCKIEVVAPVRDNMTIEEFREAVIKSALDVMSAALLRLEEPTARRRRAPASSARPNRPPH